MASSLVNLWRLMKAGRVLALHDALLQPEQLAKAPWLAQAALKLAKVGAPKGVGLSSETRLATALTTLGPSYIKLGQFLSTRPDVIGAKRAFELKSLQDRLPPFAQGIARETIENELSQKPEQLFKEFGAPVAAASIAQVHRCITRDGRQVAVKILRPDVEKRFAADIDSFGFAARMIERVSAEGRRLRPVAAVHMLDQSMKLELDLRMEAAALSEIAKNTHEDPGFRVPKVDWARTAKRVLTTEWIDGTPMSDVAALKARGINLNHLSEGLIQNFLRHAMRDGFFHADMHQGNLMVDHAGTLVALDFGITGRLTKKEGLFLAEVLYGFITRDYLRVAQIHFDVGFVPATEDVATFAQALRSIGEPTFDLVAEEISMARLLTQLFEITGQFNMVAQPQLLLLQKTMVVVEGVARTLNPNLNMWKVAEPVVRAWIERKLGPLGIAEQATESAHALARLALTMPTLFEDAQKATRLLSDMAQSGGLRLDAETTAAIAAQNRLKNFWPNAALIAGAVALIFIAVKLAF